MIIWIIAAVMLFTATTGLDVALAAAVFFLTKEA